jgi:tRNA (5-methylaminomethyl-2-thiouridylate)-methyltransferase
MVEIKFGALLDYLPEDRLFASASFFATGHYARTSIDQAKRRTKLLQAVDLQKDQSYFLSAVSEQSLSRTMFPIGHLTKPEVRELAKKFQLPTAQRPESMGVCFIGERRKFSDFMEQYIEPRPGPIVSKDSNEQLGWHKGLWQHTIGQNVKIPGLPRKMYVSEKDMKSRTLYVVAGSDNAALLHKNILVDRFRWIWRDSPPAGIYTSKGAPALAQFRHRMNPAPCTVRCVFYVTMVP